MRRHRRRGNPSGGNDSTLDILILLGVGFLLFNYVKNNPNLATALASSANPLGLSMDQYPTGTMNVGPQLSGLGRVYLSGMGMIGQGYNINETFGGDASKYEMAAKYHM